MWDEEKCRFLTSCCKKHDSPTLWIGNRTMVHFWSTPWHRRLKPMWISHYINCLWRSLIFPYFTYSDVFRHSNKKKKHWEICIETSQCLISIIEMFFSNLPMSFRLSKRTKGHLWSFFFRLSIRIVMYNADSYFVKWLWMTCGYTNLEIIFTRLESLCLSWNDRVNSWMILCVLSGLFSVKVEFGKVSDILFAFASFFNNTVN